MVDLKEIEWNMLFLRKFTKAFRRKISQLIYFSNS